MIPDAAEYCFLFRKFLFLFDAQGNRQPKNQQMKKPRPKTCPSCKAKFTPARPLQAVCANFDCVVKHIDRLKEKKEARKHRERKLKLKPRRQWLAEAQEIFNKWIRLIDHDRPCISCGRVHVEWTRGGSWDCGHFLGVGAYPELRFEELNAHKQCKKCNGGSGKYAKKNHTVSQSYEKNLIEKIGQEKVDWLKGPHEPKHYTIDDLKQIKAEYTRKVKELEARNRIYDAPGDGYDAVNRDDARLVELGLLQRT